MSRAAGDAFCCEALETLEATVAALPEPYGIYNHPKIPNADTTTPISLGGHEEAFVEIRFISQAGDSPPARSIEDGHHDGQIIMISMPSGTGGITVDHLTTQQRNEGGGAPTIGPHDSAMWRWVAGSSYWEQIVTRILVT